MNDITPYLATFLIFILKLIAGLSDQASVRTRAFVAYILAFAAFVIYLYYFDIPFSGVYIFTYGIVLPDVITRIINTRRIKSNSVQVRINTTTLVSVIGFLGAGIILIITIVVIILMFTSATSPKNEPVIDLNHILTSLSFLLMLVSVTARLYLSAIEKTTFFSEGVLHDGEIWQWADFDFFSWKKRVFENDVRELTLAPAKHAWHPAHIKLKIPPDSKDQVNSLLEKNLAER